MKVRDSEHQDDSLRTGELVKSALSKSVRGHIVSCINLVS